MSSGSSQYIRKVLHHTEAPPPINARYFYTSPIPIDDPLSPVPPSISGNAWTKQPPRAFSEYDNTALDKAWHDLRRNILEYNEEVGEKGRGGETSHPRKDSTDVKHSRGSSGSRPGTPRARPARIATSRLSQSDRPPTEMESVQGLDWPTLGSAIANQPETTGTPFVRAPSRTKLRVPQHERPARPKIEPRDTYEWDDTSHLADYATRAEKLQGSTDAPHTKVAVGVSRLHQVEMPDLQMTPIYWTPVHDSAQVFRGTWFYQDTMLPVEPAVANMLEAGYVDLQCWTETWKDELNSAIEVGAAGEMKIVHKLWPDISTKPSESRPSSGHGAAARDRNDSNLLQVATSNLIEGEPETSEQLREKAVQAACDIIDIASGSEGADNKASGTLTYGRQGVTRTYATWGVIYTNKREARLLKPTVMPSEYYSRRPLANYIKKGYKLGIPVVRGFDQATWDKLHPPTTGLKASKAEHGVATAASGAPPYRRLKSDPNLAKADRPQVTDLILVIHGIGQKLSTRMESFHFTHAMNAFRREVNVEVGSREVQARFRKDMGNIMVLPVNWRHALSFEEGGYRDENSGANEFTLDDITPDTLPSVRGIISDIVLDIPYYMSQHQPKMVAAVTREANRVYQLWCRNNPGFADSGRVHLLAHSLGSVMAIDILSRQPTSIPESLSDPASLDLDLEHLHHFLFNTSHLYVAGSPAGFFLLLKKAQLMPRIDHPSSTTLDDPLSNSSSVCGEQGQYGCIAVDNFYNVINPYDPVAYRINAAVDSTYAASLNKAVIPSATPGWFGVGRKSTSLFGGSTANARQPPLPRLPSNVEMEVHNFTREEIAEKRMLLLNDNGQIDYFLRYGGGAFEIQYLTMLGAHSSYWLLKDFIRMIVTETGRAKGKEGTFLGMRAVKKKGKFAAE